MNQTPITQIAQVTPNNASVQGTLETIGQPMLPTSTPTDISYDFQTMLMTLEDFPAFDFKFTTTDLVGTKVQNDAGVEFDYTLYMRAFQYGLSSLALRSHRFFTGSPTLHFYCPKMDVQTGVLEFRYFMGIHQSDLTPNLRQQLNMTQWDISQNNYFVYQIPNFQPYTFRTTEMSQTIGDVSYIETTEDQVTTDYSLALCEQNNGFFGRLSITIAHPLVNGNIAPNRLNIKCFYNFPNSQLSTYCALRRYIPITTK